MALFAIMGPTLKLDVQGWELIYKFCVGKESDYPLLRDHMSNKIYEKEKNLSILNYGIEQNRTK